MPGSDEQGAIPLCQHAGCGHLCCDFSGGNYIVLYPGELNDAVSQGRSIAHLETRPSSDGGHRAICHAGDTASCDGGYKPLDCASYPFFPAARPDGGVEMELFGARCPLSPGAIRPHERWAHAQWQRLVSTSHAVRRWMRATSVLGYRSLRRSRVEPPATSELRTVEGNRGHQDVA